MKFICYFIFTPYIIFSQVENFLDSVSYSNNYSSNASFLEKKIKNYTYTDTTRYKILSALVTNYVQDREYEKSIKICQEEILKAQNENNSFIEANLYVALAKTYYHLNQMENVLLYNRKGLQIATENNYTELLKRCYHNLAALEFETGHNYIKAKDYLLRAIEIGKKIPGSKNVNLGNQYRLLGTTYDVLNDYVKADSALLLAEQIFKKFNDTLGLSDVLTFRARVYYSQKKYYQATALINNALELVRPTKNKDFLQVALSMYEQILVAEKKFEQAYTIKNEIFYLNIASNSENQKKEIAIAEAKFKVAELANKQKLAEVEADQKQRFITFVFIIIIIIVAILLFIMYQKRLTVQKRKIELESLRKIYEAEENERTRIAKDLHDNMGAYATSLLAQIDIIEYDSKTDLDKKVLGLRQDTENIMQILRETIWILKNREITIQNFYDLIKNYANKHLMKNLNIKIQYITSNNLTEINISPNLSVNLYRIVQEVIQNIIKHSKATEVTFSVKLKNNKLYLKITDNGIGFNITNLESKSGLENMKHRADEINFEFTVTSSLNEGTKIEVIQI